MNRSIVLRHFFAHCSTAARRALPDNALFTAERGERCVPLMPCWPELLSDFADLGPVALVSQNAFAQFARCVPEVEFAPVPGGTEVVELGSTFIADTAEWAHALAVEEPVPGGCLFSLQFFGADGAGLWKLLLTRDAQLEHFAGMVRHYASGAFPPEGRACPASTPNRLAELQRRGCALAQEVARETITSTLLAARREERALSVTVGRGGLSLSGTLVPRCLERCPCAVHAYDRDAEFHLATRETFRVWRVRERGASALEILDAGGALVARIAGLATE